MERKLAAILYADVAGYSRLTGADEEGTHEALRNHRAVLLQAIGAEAGRTCHTAGDAVLAQFGSVVAALKSAVAAQRDLAKRNAALTENRRLEFRIGVNLGDVIVDGPQIYGNGVNVAARLETLAEPGGICICSRVLEQVEDKLDVGFVSLGSQFVKNIKKPVNVYKVLLDSAFTGQVVEMDRPATPQWPQPPAALVPAPIVAARTGTAWSPIGPPEFDRASVERVGYSLHDKPSIAVLPFDNLSGEKAQDAVADGLTQDIIATLSQSPDLFVIARNSTSTYKGKPVKVQEVAKELGIQYVLEGSVQRANDQLRVTAQLIDALSGRNLWADRYDRKAENLFAVQDEIAHKVLIKLQAALILGEDARFASHRTLGLVSEILRRQAYTEGSKYTDDGMLKARELYRTLIDADPQYSRAWAGLAWTYYFEARLGGLVMSREQALKKGEESAERAIEINPRDSLGYLQLANVSTIKGEQDRAVALAEKAAALASGDVKVKSVLAYNLIWAGQLHRAVELFQEAKRFGSPYPWWIDAASGLAYYLAGQHDQAIVDLKRGVIRAPTSVYARARLIAVYADTGRLEEAKDEAAALLKAVPGFTVTEFVHEHPFKDVNLKTWLRNALLKAGLPKDPAPKLPDKPSIAVLPFDNLSGDPEQEHLADGMTEHIITTLSRCSDFSVIARNSSFTYKKKPLKIKRIAKELGVSYVLEGSIQKSGDRLRVTAQLIDALDSRQLWSDRSDCGLENLFALQEEIAQKILLQLKVEFAPG